MVLLGVLISHEQGSSCAGLLHEDVLVCDVLQDLLGKQDNNTGAGHGPVEQRMQKPPEQHQELLS